MFVLIIQAPNVKQEKATWHDKNEKELRACLKKKIALILLHKSPFACM